VTGRGGRPYYYPLGKDCRMSSLVLEFRKSTWDRDCPNAPVTEEFS